MDFPGMIAALREHPEARKMGMIASHLGVVRGSSRDGRLVTGIEVMYDHDRLGKIVDEMKRLPGIVDIRVEIREGLLEVGDEILAVAVGGDIRENVFDALIKTVDRIKAEASKKRESFA
ncbi:MAG: molybdenum cofactor biosynthesis protein MoaE [Deltaproteobacteria bacterium HGW-Deltaproteobacteria-15]|nr:MAG: molybdenum cofactor biosynthesis protein MoaE [Deltaproteobacteria bacterium HGW-Deltaproteobacteria-15]